MREITLTLREQKRVMVLSRLDRGEANVAQAAVLLGLSERQVQRIRAAYREEGAAALMHGNRGRAVWNTTSEETRRQVVALAQSTYQGCNHQHLTELLAERKGIVLHSSTVKRILGSAGVRSPRTRRGRRHRSRRERYPQEGMLLQVDGSRHDWLEGRGPWLTLIAAIDDATGDVPVALFREQEDAAGYMLLLEAMVGSVGRPLAVYHDRHGIFERSKTDRQTLEEELAGRRETTQVERVLEELAITSIAARSPQAKGRVERLFGTLQDRLVSELRLAGIGTLSAANAFLPGFLRRFNRQFRVPAAQGSSSYRAIEGRMRPEAIFCFKYLRIVGSDNVVRFAGRRLQIRPSHGRVSHAKAEVEVHERVDGSVQVYYQGKRLATAPAPEEAPMLRARYGRRPPAVPNRPRDLDRPATTVGVGDQASVRPFQISRKPAADHPWRRTFKNPKSAAGSASREDEAARQLELRSHEIEEVKSALGVTKSLSD